jgi:hypothetical protein
MILPAVASEFTRADAIGPWVFLDAEAAGQGPPGDPLYCQRRTLQDLFRRYFHGRTCSVFGLGASVSARILSLCDRNIVFSSPTGSQEKYSAAYLFGRTRPVGIPRQPAFHDGLRQLSLHRMCSATSGVMSIDLLRYFRWNGCLFLWVPAA